MEKCVWRSIFSRPSLGPWQASGFQLVFFSPFTLKQPFYHLLVPKAIVFCSFPLTFSLCQHELDLRQQCLNMRIISFLHENAP